MSEIPADVMDEAPSHLAMQLSAFLTTSSDDLTITERELASLCEDERLILGRTAAKFGWSEHRNPAHPGVIKLVRSDAALKEKEG